MYARKSVSGPFLEVSPRTERAGFLTHRSPVNHRRAKVVPPPTVDFLVAASGSITGESGDSVLT